MYLLNEIVKAIVFYYIIYANHFDRPGINVTILKIKNLSVVTSLCPKYYCTQLSCSRKSCGEI